MRTGDVLGGKGTCWAVGRLDFLIFFLGCLWSIFVLFLVVCGPFCAFEKEREVKEELFFHRFFLKVQREVNMKHIFLWCIGVKVWIEVEEMEFGTGTGG